jgi:hypothetical protein
MKRDEGLKGKCSDGIKGSSGMKTDFYTKAVLTVIAGCLMGILFQNGIKKSFADEPGVVQKVAICDQQGDQCVPIYSGGSDFQSGLGVAVVNNH